ASRARSAAQAGPAPDTAEAAPPDAGAPAETLVIRHPLRSGQRIYARGGDLIVMGMVSQGAEVIADGHIHVYGPLRGKAMAGARGNARAMILTTQLDPELLAIAGVYRVVETRLPDTLLNRPAQVELDGDTLRIRTLQGGH
ncbi:septum site-determining protein MinC, partial [Castellaniella defragrans]